MKRVAVIFVVVGLVCLVAQFEIFARGGGGGGGGGRGGGGGGGSRGGSGGGGGGGFSPSSSGRAPSAAARPSGGGARPSAPAAATRPAGGGGKNAVAKSGGAKPGGAAKPGAGAAAGQRPGAGGKNAAGARPSAGDVNNFLDLPTGGAGIAAAGAAGAAGAARQGGAAADFLQQGPGVAQQPAGGRTAAGVAAGVAVAGRPGVGAPGVGRPGVGVGAPGVGRPGTPGDNLAQNRPGRVENRGERQGNRTQRRDEIHNQYHQNNPGNFWQENPGWTALAITRPFAWATWGSVGNWCGYSGEPTSYSYGEDVYYTDDQVYVGDQPVATAEEYTQQAEEIVAAAPSEAAEKGDWLPLGVFAITQDGEASGPAPSIYMQLAISKQGVISGTLKNTLDAKVQSLEGMADKMSQRVAWAVSGQQRPIMETGLSNLTQDTAPALIHFADGQTQQWLMVRLPESDAKK